MDYSHPRFYLVIALIGILLTVIFGMNIQRGFYFGVLGMGIFPFLYNLYKDEYDRDERNLIMEFALSILGFVFLPIGYFAGIFNSIVPTTVDFVFFIIGFSAMTIVTSLLYLFEPDTPKQTVLVIMFSSVMLFLIVVMIKLYTIAGYLGVKFI